MDSMDSMEIRTHESIETDDVLDNTADGEDIPTSEATDLEELSLICPGITDENADEYCNLERYRELRALGLSGEEAYAATARKRPQADSRSHLSSLVGRGSSAPRGGMSEAELRTARDIFCGMSDAEIRRLYKRVI